MSKPKAEQSSVLLVGTDVPGEPGREEDMDDFNAEWCQKLLKDSSYCQAGIPTRKMLAGHCFNTLMGKTLFNDGTFRAIRTLYKPAEAVQSVEADDWKGADHIGGQLLALISVGTEMCSHTNVLHGGINTVLVDEIGGDLASKEIPDPLMAVNFNVALRKSVKTPGIILGRAWIDRKPEGRKIWVKIRLEQDGQTCIEAENLYLKMNPAKEKL